MGDTDRRKTDDSGGQFLIDIKYAQNSSWQGNVTWVNGKKTVPFRSALELIKLIDSVVEHDRYEWLEEIENEQENGGSK